MSPQYAIARNNATRIAMLCAVALLLAAVSCGKSGKSDGQAGMNAADSAEMILNVRPEFDADAVANLAAHCEQGLTPVQISTALVQCCAAADQMQQSLDRLAVVDDPADTYQTFVEMRNSADATNIRLLYNYLSRQNVVLTPAQEQRRTALTQSIMRINQTAAELHDRHLAGYPDAVFTL